MNNSRIGFVGYEFPLSDFLYSDFGISNLQGHLNYLKSKDGFCSANSVKTFAEAIEKIKAKEPFTMNDTRMGVSFPTHANIGINNNEIIDGVRISVLHYPRHSKNPVIHVYYDFTVHGLGFAQMQSKIQECETRMKRNTTASLYDVAVRYGMKPSESRDPYMLIDYEA